MGLLQTGFLNISGTLKSSTGVISLENALKNKKNLYCFPSKNTGISLLTTLNSFNTLSHTGTQKHTLR